MVRFYLVPIITNGPPVTRKVPKYFVNIDRNLPALMPPGMVLKEYPSRLAALVAHDLSDADNTLLLNTSISDGTPVTKFADNLDQALGVDLGAIQTALENIQLPGDMLTAATTHRRTVRGILGTFSIAERMAGQGFDLYGPGITLSTTFGALPTGQMAALLAAAQAEGYDTTGATTSTTMRVFFRQVSANAFPETMLGVTV